MTTISCPRVDQLAAMLEETLPPQVQGTVQSHVDGCPACQQKIERLIRDSSGKSLSFSDLGKPLESAPIARHGGTKDGPTIALDPLDKERSQPDLADDLALDFLSPPDDPRHLGKLGHYEILAVVGRGGLGVVLKGYDTRLKRVVAIKAPLTAFAANAAARKRFAREAEAAAAVSHDHVVTIHAVEPDKYPYLVMEYIDGVSLQDKLDASGPLELKEILRIGMQMARGLAAAHEQGLVHRDIKPANILLENGVQRVKITDFGLARAVDDIGITQTGAVAGTPQFMSPEQAHGASVDHRSDLFSLGGTLYAMCTGRSPFRAETTMAVLKRVCEDAPKPIHKVNPEIPEWLAEIILKLLEKKPENRFQSAQEVADLLSRHLAHLQQPEANPQPERLRAPLPMDGRQTATRPTLVRNAVLACGGLSMVLFAVLALLLGGLFVAVNVLKRPTGQLTLNLRGPDVAVTLNGKSIEVQETRAVMAVSPGDYELVSLAKGEMVSTEWHVVGQLSSYTVNIAPQADAVEIHGPLSGSEKSQRFARAERAGVGAEEPRSLSARLSVGGRRLSSGGDHPNWSPDGRQVMHTIRGAVIEIIDADADESRTLLAGDALFPAAEIADADWSPDGRFVVFVKRPKGSDHEGMRDQELWLLTVESGATQKVAEGNYPSWSADGKRLYYHAQLPQQVCRLSVDDLPTSPVEVMPCPWYYPAVSPDERYVAYGGDGRLTIAPTTPGEPTRSWQLPRETAVGMIAAWSPDSREVAVTAYGSKFLGLWIYDLEREAGVEVTDAPVRSVDWSPDGARMVLNIQGGGLQNWVAPLAPGRSTADSLRSLFSGESPSLSHPIEIARSSRILSSPLAQSDMDVYALAFTKDGGRAVTGHFGGEALIWDVAQGKPRYTLEGHVKAIHAIAISPEKRLVATGGEDSIIRLWNLDTGEAVKEIRGHSGWVMSMAFRSGGKELVSASWDFKDFNDNTIRLWNVETGEERWRIADNLRFPVELALAPDETWAVVSDAAYGRVGLWDFQTQSPRHFFEGFATTPESVALSGDGALVAAGYHAQKQVDGQWNDPDNAVVRLWNADSGRLLHELRGHSGSILSVQFSPDDRYVLSLASDLHDESGKFIESSDHTARIWDAATGRELARFQIDRANVARWLPDGRSICTGVRIWDVPERLWQTSSE